jgi:hypothetical protein
MLLADGLNGWWIGHLVQRVDALAPRASRRTGLAVAALSLGVAGLGIARQLSTGVDRGPANRRCCSARPRSCW